MSAKKSIVNQWIFKRNLVEDQAILLKWVKTAVKISNCGNILAVLSFQELPDNNKRYGN